MLSNHKKTDLKNMLAYLTMHVSIKVTIDHAKQIYAALNGDSSAWEHVNILEIERFINQQTWPAFLRVNQYLIDIPRGMRNQIILKEQKN